jgi:hypothetical protein
LRKRLEHWRHGQKNYRQEAPNWPELSRFQRFGASHES